MNERRVANDAKRGGLSFEDQERNMTLLGRGLEPVEFVRLVVYRAREDARMMTEQTAPA